MAQNPYVNKVVFGNDTLVDLTEDSVTASNLLEGETAHNAAGAPVTGTAKQGHTIENPSGTDMPQRATLKFGGYFNVSDDDENNMTVVDDAHVEVEWTVWQNMTDAQKAGKRWKIINAPASTLTGNDVAYDTSLSVNEKIDDVETTAELRSCLVVTQSSISSLPTTISNVNITSDMVVVNSVLSNPAAQLSDWSWTTANGSITLSGTISGTTNITLYLMKSR